MSQSPPSLTVYPLAPQLGRSAETLVENQRKCFQTASAKGIHNRSQQPHVGKGEMLLPS